VSVLKRFVVLQGSFARIDSSVLFRKQNWPEKRPEKRPGKKPEKRAFLVLLVKL
jgi:hypothetical protein